MNSVRSPSELRPPGPGPRRGAAPERVARREQSCGLFPERPRASSNPSPRPIASARPAKISQSGRGRPERAADGPHPLGPPLPVGVRARRVSRPGGRRQEGVRVRLAARRAPATGRPCTGRSARARRASAASGKSRSGSTPTRNRTSISRRAQRLEDPRRRASRAAGISRAPRPPRPRPRSSSSATRRPPGSSAGCSPARSAPRSLARRVHAARTRAPHSLRDRQRRRAPAGARQARSASDHARRPAGLAQRARPTRPSNSARGCVAAVDPGQHVRLVAGPAEQVLGDVVQPGRPRDGPRRPSRPVRTALRIRRCRIGTSCSASSPTRRMTFGALDVAVGRPAMRPPRRASSLGASAVRAPAMVDVVRPERRPRQLGERVRVLVGQATAGQERDARPARPLGDRLEAPRRTTRARARGRGAEGVVTPRRAVGVAEREPALVAEPRVVDVEVVAGECANDLASSQVDPDVAPARCSGGRRCPRSTGRTVAPRTGTASTVSAPDRADLHGVAAERRAEVLARRRSRPARRRPARTAR